MRHLFLHILLLSVAGLGFSAGNIPIVLGALAGITSYWIPPPRHQRRRR